MSPLASAAVDTAARYLFVRETHGKNRSPEIDMMNRTAGVPLASSWCISFVYTSWTKAAGSTHRNPLLRTGAVWRMLAHARRLGSGFTVLRMGRYFQRTTAYKGDIGIISNHGTDDRLIGKQWYGHGFMVTKTTTADTVETIEGNSDRAGSREGVRVIRRRRAKAKLLALVRYTGDRP